MSAGNYIEALGAQILDTQVPETAAWYTPLELQLLTDVGLW